MTTYFEAHPLGAILNLMGFRLVLISALLWISPKSFAPHIEILYRQSLSTVPGSVLYSTDLPSFKKDPLAAAGHVAIRLPPYKFGLGATVYGWTPQLEGELSSNEPAANMTPDERLAYMSNYDVPAQKWKTLPGAFQNNEMWALDGINHPSLPTRSIALELTDAQLEILLNNMRRLQMGHTRYQFSPMRSQSFDENSYNCASAVLEVFMGTGVDLSFLPSRGSMPGFYRAAEKSGLSHAWQPCDLLNRALARTH